MLLAQDAIATVYPYLYAKLAYDPIADSQPASLAAELILGVALGPAVPDSVTSVRELVDRMRANPTTRQRGFARHRQFAASAGSHVAQASRRGRAT